MTPYGRPGDRITFYEINPDVIALANSAFTYLRDSRAEVKIVEGDARLSIEREVAGDDFAPYDVLFVDAFSGDAIPVHLLTREAFELYWRRIRPGGVLAMHISNEHLDLTGLVRGLASEFAKEALWVTNEEYDDEGIWAADWVLITENRPLASAIVAGDHVTPWEDTPIIIWSDKFSNLLSVLR